IYLPSSTFKDKQKQIQSSKDKDDQLIKDVVKPPNKEFLKIFGDIREKKDQKRDKKQNTPSQKAPKPDVGRKQSTFKDPKYDYNGRQLDKQQQQQQQQQQDEEEDQDSDSESEEQKIMSKQEKEKFQQFEEYFKTRDEQDKKKLPVLYKVSDEEISRFLSGPDSPTMFGKRIEQNKKK
ncbi:MAG: hypothetical protein EZS28_020644, partial [Streblomastix strix]